MNATYDIGPEFDDEIVIVRADLRDGKALTLKQRMLLSKILEEHQERIQRKGEETP